METTKSKNNTDVACPLATVYKLESATRKTAATRTSSSHSSRRGRHSAHVRTSGPKRAATKMFIAGGVLRNLSARLERNRKNVDCRRRLGESDMVLRRAASRARGPRGEVSGVSYTRTRGRPSHDARRFGEAGTNMSVSWYGCCNGLV
ncbi:hypothetical protein HIM_04665 [Hirsutella minnesotensis 3608]|uniref:Uncharacterized protein n=1 Tax=Hirsutella minnesotensis 3608 TaxID=1043627 RepID=A0A0F7ZL04_9HYPO|nr:hypothetical protein HIM_04665 [Hirsutella minnesotensis 3608]